MEIVTEKDLQDNTYKVILHSKKVNTYTNVELVMLYRLRHEPVYNVVKKMAIVNSSDNLESALEYYNKIQSFKKAPTIN